MMPGCSRSPKGDFSVSKLRDPGPRHEPSSEAPRKLGFHKSCAPSTIWRGTHETLAAGWRVPLRTVADRCGHESRGPARNYAKRTKKGGHDGKARQSPRSLKRLAGRGGHGDPARKATCGKDKLERDLKGAAGALTYCGDAKATHGGW